MGELVEFINKINIFFFFFLISLWVWFLEIEMKWNLPKSFLTLAFLCKNFTIYFPGIKNSDITLFFFFTFFSYLFHLHRKRTRMSEKRISTKCFPIQNNQKANENNDLCTWTHFSEVATELYVPKTVLSVRLIERIF